MIHYLIYKKVLWMPVLFPPFFWGKLCSRYSCYNLRMQQDRRNIPVGEGSVCVECLEEEKAGCYLGRRSLVITKSWLWLGDSITAEQALQEQPWIWPVMAIVLSFFSAPEVLGLRRETPQTAMAFWLSVTNHNWVIYRMSDCSVYDIFKNMHSVL